MATAEISGVNFTTVDDTIIVGKHIRTIYLKVTINSQVHFSAILA